MIEWKEAKVTRPEDNESCFITVIRNELSSYPIIGPIIYKKEGDLYLDFFATLEAGACYVVEDTPDIWWCPEEQLNLPGGEE